MLNRPTHSILVTGLFLSAMSSVSFAQQFQYQPGLLPGVNRWTEGVEAADVDNDGDLDIFFAEGEGFSSPGAQRQNILLINSLAGSGTLAYTDESVPRLGVHLSIAKGVATGDVDGDGYIDAVFANAFNTDVPFLYINQGAGNAGFFTEDGAARGLTEILSSAGAGLGDLDDDGDLDLILNDVGNNFLGGSGDRPNLYINDGTGHFTEKQGAGWNPPTKVAQMDVQLVDIDNDMDLDFVGYCRGGNSGGNHYLMINDGNANFVNSSSTLVDGSTSCYEAELGDLDGDLDTDIFMVSLSGFREGAIRNNLVESGSLSFTAQAPLTIAQDDNEIALCDYDNDGDLDVAVGSLGSKERLYRNDGGLVFAGASGMIQTQSDPSLDCTFADLDNDGDYDFITAQGEGGGSNSWTNKVYINSGPADTTAPRFMDNVPVGTLTTSMGPWVGKAKIQDSVIDDGRNWVNGVAHYAVVAGLTPGAIGITAGGFSPSNVNIAPGGSVIFNNTSGSNQSVTSGALPYTFDSGTLANGQLFELVLVQPGTYQVISTPSGATCTVTVTGSAQSVPMSYSGGGIYRAAMTGNASAAGSVLVYEYEFTDWAGNKLVTPVQYAGNAAGPLGTAFCFGDGTGTSCPCGNTGAAGAGCANSAGANGAVLTGLGTASIASDSAMLIATDCPPNKPGVFFQGALQSVNGSVFGDGLLCASGQIIRLQTVFSDAQGVAQSSVVLSLTGGLNPGDVRSYQFWYRDPAGSPCGNGFNTTNGLEITWN